MKKLLILVSLLFTAPAWAVDCFVSSYRYLGTDGNGNIAQAIIEPALGTQKVTFTATSVQSSAFPSGTQVIRVVCDAKAHFEVGSNPTASNADPYVAANTPEYFAISASSMEIAFQDGT